jgi:hypothetical protein
VDVGRIGIDISQSDPSILYSIYADSIGYFKGVYKTFDRGGSWSQTNDASLSNMFSSFGWWFGRIHVDPTDPDIIYPMGLYLHKSEDGGTSYSQVSTGVHVDQHDIVAHPIDNESLVLGNDGGIYISGDGADSWSHLENLPIMQFYTCEADEQYPERLYGGAQDMGTNRTLTGNTDDWDRIYGGDGFCVLVDFINNEYVYAEYQYGGLARSVNGGITFSPAVSGISGQDRKNWKCPLIFDPLDPSVLYFGTEKLYRSTDRAESWTAISDDLSNGAGSHNLVYGTLTTIAISPADSDVIYCGTDDGNVWVTLNGGSGWSKISDELPERWVTAIAVDPYDAQRAFVCLSGYRYDSYLPHVFMTENAGTDWQDISSGLPEAPVNDVVADPSVDSTLYVATDFGVYVSWDYGLHWQMLGGGLPNVPVVDIRLHDPSRKLIAATYGRSMYTFNLGAIVSNKEILVNQEDLMFYPNPAREQISLQIESKRVNRIRIYSINGGLVREMDHPSGTVDISMLKKGLYVIEFVLDDNLIRQKLLVH